MPGEPTESAPRILIIEDQDSVSKVLSILLRREKYQPLTSRDAASALTLLRSQPVELILLDMTLPDMNGMTLFEIIHAQENLRHIPVVFLTGDLTLPSKLKAFEAGAVDYITKPFDYKELIARLRVHLRNKSELDARRERSAEAARQAQLSLKAAQQRFNALVQNSYDLVCELTADLNIAYLSPNHRAILQHEPKNLRGTPWLDFVHPDDRPMVADGLRSILHRATATQLHLRFLDSENDWRWLETGGSLFSTELGETRLLLVSRDITKIKETEAYLQQLALKDSLTGLGNRQMFSQELAEVVANPGAANRHAVMYFDLDNFKMINDTKGHLVGDQVLCSVTRAVQATLNERHLICRHGGDEFCILLRDVNATEAQAEGDRIVLAFRKAPIGVEGNQLGITISAGIAMVEGDTSAEEVLTRANSALHAAKARGKNRCRFYHSGNRDIRTIRSSAEWVARIDEGLAERRFEIWYQPMVNLADRTELCREALLRYRSEDGTVHYPSEFMPGAERYHLMSKVDRYVVRNVLEDLKQHSGLRASINLSGSSITEPGMVDFIMSSFEKSGVPPNRVVFEITETVFIANLTQAQAMVRHLQELGCQFALDDFGSGFSSLNYLKNLPVNIVKIDGSFIQSIATDNVDYALLRSINEIAHLLGKKTVAEYVDSDHSWEMLNAIGVDYGQGFHIGKPAPLNAVEVPVS